MGGLVFQRAGCTPHAHPPRHRTLYDAAAVKLVLVEESIADELVPRVVEGVKRMSVGM